MAEYEHREAAYASTMEEQIKGFSDVIIEGDNHTKDKAFERTMQVLSAPNEQLESVMSLLGIEPGLKYSASLPVLLFMEMSGYGYDNDTYIEGHMDVHASTSESEHKKVESSGDVEAKVGWGPVSAKVKIHASAGVE